ncbi:GntR family transcriptional regulator [Herbaspirillum seropedicae]|uniref:GntR family transcriptional regulator n=1 Tax=Herbaspirillum seropedicae TaxID=964 RepID=UPI00111EEAB5|nr:GntR family transcriptional regulator [Herbaspirillum seropedicae]QDD66690.1 GntR family transcriptional regulator [Herbaspirillum seropedicae]
MERGKEKVYEVLRQRLVGGQYKPGTQLKEEPLARELGVSRTPVRTALRRLVEDGLATADAGQGIHVAAWSDWDIEETFQLRMLLEPYAASLAAERGDEKMLALLRESNEKMAQAIKSGGLHSVEKIQAANSIFHRTILEYSASPRLRAMLETIIDMPIIVRSFHLYEKSELEQSLHHHQDLLLAMQARDAELARQVMQLHLRMSYHRFMRRRSQYEDMGAPE